MTSHDSFITDIRQKCKALYDYLKTDILTLLDESNIDHSEFTATLISLHVFSLEPISLDTKLHGLLLSSYYQHILTSLKLILSFTLIQYYKKLGLHSELTHRVIRTLVSNL